MQKTIPIFIHSAGALLLALASAMFLINWTIPPDAMLPHDPIFLKPLDEWFWIIGGIAAVMALICLFCERPITPAFLLLWLAVNYLACRIDLMFEGCHSLPGYLGGFSYAFGISAAAVSIIADTIFVYLLMGSCLTLWLARRLPPPLEFQKTACPSCGCHIKFAAEHLGQKINCPSCTAIITLRKPNEIIKMSCFFCKEHIEFSAHALGRKIKCPHCEMEVGLREESL